MKKLLDEKLCGLSDAIGEDNINVRIFLFTGSEGCCLMSVSQDVKELYAELEKIGKSGKSPEEMSKPAKKVVESKVGTFDELKRKATDVAGQAKDKAAGKSSKIAAGIPGLDGLSKVSS